MLESEKTAAALVNWPPDMTRNFSRIVFADQSVELWFVFAVKLRVTGFPPVITMFDTDTGGWVGADHGAPSYWAPAVVKFVTVAM